MDKPLRKYMAKIGSKGGKKSRRTLTPEAAKAMVRLREARRAYRQFHTQCFWSYRADYKVSPEAIEWVAKRLMTFGGWAGWEKGAKLLCR
jgi:hypothetical protein